MAVSGYRVRSDPAKIEATLADAKPDELPDLLRLLDLLERNGYTPSDEADEWRRSRNEPVRDSSSVPKTGSLPIHATFHGSHDFQKSFTFLCGNSTVLSTRKWECRLRSIYGVIA